MNYSPALFASFHHRVARVRNINVEQEADDSVREAACHEKTNVLWKYVKKEKIVSPNAARLFLRCTLPLMRKHNKLSRRKQSLTKEWLFQLTFDELVLLTDRYDIAFDYPRFRQNAPFD